MHVAYGVDVNEGANKGYSERHYRGQLVKPESHLSLKRSCSKPCVKWINELPRLRGQCKQFQVAIERNEKGENNRCYGNGMNTFFSVFLENPVPKNSVYSCTNQRKQWNQENESSLMNNCLFHHSTPLGWLICLPECGLPCCKLREQWQGQLPLQQPQAR